MAISVSQWYNQFCAKERLSDSSSFRASFIEAVNQAIGTLNVRAFQELDEITDVDTDSIDLDVTFKPILNTLLRYFLQESGQWTKDPDPRLEQKMDRAISDARSRWWGDTPPWAGGHGGALSDDE